MTERFQKPTDMDEPVWRILDIALAGSAIRSITSVRGGRTSAVWCVSLHVGPDLIAKHSRTSDGNALFPNDPWLEWAAMTHLSPLGLAPHPVAAQALPNDAKLLLGQKLPSTADLNAPQLAHLLAKIHKTVPWPGLPTAISDPERILDQGDHFLNRYDAPRWLTALRPKRAGTPFTGRPALLHRDLVPANIASPAPGHAVALDWQCPAVGDPVEDLAHASSPAMQSLSPAHAQLPIEAIVAAYPNPSVRARFFQTAAAYRWRMVCYCQWQYDRGQDVYRAARDLECAALEQAQQTQHKAC